MDSEPSFPIKLSPTLKSHVEINYIPFSLGQGKSGPELGPEQISSSNLIPLVKENTEYQSIKEYCFEKWKSAKHNRSEEEKKIHGSYDYSSVCKANSEFAQKCFEIAKRDHFCLNIGGDHSIAVGTIAGALKRYPNLRIVWVDAHADINTPSTSTSGNMHGMPVSFLAHYAKPGFPWLRDYPVLQPDRIVYIGLRDVDPGEKMLLKNAGILSYSMTQVDELGIGQVMKEALKHLDPQGIFPIHLSFDIDGLDPDVTPSTGTPVMGGLSFREGRFICETLFSTNRLVSADVVELNPTIGNSEDRKTTVKSTVQLILSILGKQLL